MGLAETLAARKAAVANNTTATIDLTGAIKISDIDTPVSGVLDLGPSFEKTDVAKGLIPQASASVPSSVASVSPVRELTFLEKLALKKKETGPTEPVTSTEAPTKESLVATPIAVEPVPASVPLTLEPQTESEQAYSDIRNQIAAFETISDEEDLKSAMSTLKKALMANPAAVSLMEDTDFGKMVIALRRYVREATLATKDAKTKKEREPKNKSMTQEEILKGFDEL